MKFPWKPFSIPGLILALIVTPISSSLAGPTVVVVPLGNKPTGNAKPGDVLVGKTFSNASARGLQGKRAPTPLHSSRQIYCIDDNGAPDFTSICNSEQEAWESYNPPVGEYIPHRWVKINDIVYDRSSGLVWEKTPSDAPRSHAEAVTYCKDLVLTLNPGVTLEKWRMPTVVELQSLVDYGVTNSPPLVDIDAFGNISTEYPYWTITAGVTATRRSVTNAGSPGDADFYFYSVNFQDGTVGQSGTVGDPPKPGLNWCVSELDPNIDKDKINLILNYISQLPD